jgi:DNA-binding phage protein
MVSEIETTKTALPPTAPLSTLTLNEREFRAFLRTMAERYGSISELARRMEVDRRNLGKVINGKRAPGPELLSKVSVRVARVYELTVETEADGITGP